MSTAPTTDTSHPPSPADIDAALPEGWAALHDRQVHPGEGAHPIPHLLLAPGHLVLASPAPAHLTGQAARALSARVQAPVTPLRLAPPTQQLSDLREGVWHVPLHRLPGWLATRDLQPNTGAELALALRLPLLLPAHHPRAEQPTEVDVRSRRRAGLQLAAVLLALLAGFAALSALATWHKAPPPHAMAHSNARPVDIDGPGVSVPHAQARAILVSR